jgi:hypothetical protein
VFEIAAATSLESAGNRCISLQLKGDYAMKTLQSTCSYLEPLCYPILFPYGEQGWGSELQNTIYFSDYLASRFLMPDKTSNDEVLKTLSSEGVLVPINRFQLFARLGQHYIVDQVSRAIDYRANWHKHNENTVFGGMKNVANNAADVCGEEFTNNTMIFDDPELIATNSFHESSSSIPISSQNRYKLKSEPSFLSQSFHGSKRHLQKLAKNALAIVTELGKPTLFLTVTCNPKWPDITSRLLQGQTAFI